MTFGSLFAGIGGIDLGLERAGMTCVWQVEKDEYARRVLEKHWPKVERWDDVRTFPPDPPASANFLYRPDLICGGFPCQDISHAGQGAGIKGERSGLWGEFARIIRLFRPGFVLVENVAALLGRGLGRVLGDLAACGFDAEWDCIPAASVGCPHERDRLFIIAYPAGSQKRGTFARNGNEETQERPAHSASSARRCALLPGVENWHPEPRICRVDDGVSANVDRIAGLGNAVVPQVAEWIGKRIIMAGYDEPGQ